MSREKKYIFDNDDFRVRKDEKKVLTFLKAFAVLLVASLSLTVVYYFVFSLFFSTDRERSLRNENRMIERLYPEMQTQADLLSGVVSGLRQRDDALYEEIFKTAAPDVDRLLSVELLPLEDSLDGAGIVRLTGAKADMLIRNALEVEANLQRVFEISAREDFSMPPMRLPLTDFSFQMTGASVGRKINPFYKVMSRHDGMDLLASPGDSVVAAAAGTVSNITRSYKGLGNVVEIDHGNGYRTRYAHLTDIKVSKGRKVEEGALIGSVGMTGKTFAPHLHYEVYKDTTVMDPVNFFFGSVNPYEYTGMFIVSVITGQSLD